LVPEETSKHPLTYADAGVNLSERQRIIERYRDVARGASRPEVLGGIGPFAGLFALGNRYRDPVIVSTTDTVGTKGKLAALIDRYEGLGYDIVNHCVNDAFTTGAEPLFFMDTIVNADLAADAKVALVKGVADACRELGIALLGGETADMPGVYVPGGFDLIGFVVGVVERDAVIDGRGILPGDLLFGLPSNGLHTNGYSLARAALGIGIDDSSESQQRERLLRPEPELGETLADALLRPHYAYFNDLRPALQLIKGMAHITGGAFEENIPRILPDATGARLDRNWTVPPIFRLIQREGGIDEEEMYRVFNMGIGMVVAVALGDAERLHQTVPSSLPIGQVTARSPSEPRVRWA
jgi:phosphoribosylformylglycinamidine cyclo-ligase